MKLIVIGGVTSTKILIDKLLDSNIADVTVYGYEPKDHSLVSGWTDLSYSQNKGYAYKAFQKINDFENEIVEANPDYIFVVGLSQLVSRKIIDAAKKFSIGFHPTALPKGRGRAPLAWITEKCGDAAATFFELTENADEGQIFIQTPFLVEESDDAESVEAKLLIAEKYALDGLIFSIKNEQLKGVQQSEEQATFNGKRTHLDGCINWENTAYKVDRLIKAATRPHPGAFTFFEDLEIKIWKSEVLFNSPYNGVVGTIQKVDKEEFIIQCLDHCIKVKCWSAANSWSPKVGMRLGYIVSLEINQLRKKVEDLAERLEVMETSLKKVLSNKL